MQLICAIALRVPPTLDALRERHPLPVFPGLRARRWLLRLSDVEDLSVRTEFRTTVPRVQWDAHVLQSSTSLRG